MRVHRQSGRSERDLSASYGINGYDYKFIYNLAMYYQAPFFKHMHGLARRVLDGWVIAPLFTAQSGTPISVGYAPGSFLQAFGETNSTGSSPQTENAVGASPYTGGTIAYYNVPGSGTIGTTNPYGVNMFANPAAVYAEFRPCVLGIDTSCGGYTNLRGPSRWNLDATISKDIAIVPERVGATLTFQITNVPNHVAMGNPSLSLISPQFFGRITSQANTPRQMEFGLRIHF